MIVTFETVARDPNLRKLTRGIYRRGKWYWFSAQKRGKRRWLPLGTQDLSRAIIEASRKRRSSALESGAIVKHSIERFVGDMHARRIRGDRYGWADATARSKIYVLRNFAGFCGPILPSEIREEHLRDYYEARAGSTSATTAFGNLMTVRAYLKWCIRVERSVAENPFAEFHLAAPARRARADFCSSELVGELISDCPRLDLKFVLYCGFHCGLRFLEIVEARPFWFDLQRKLLNLRKTATIQFKDQEERTVPMTAELVSFIKNEFGMHEPFMLHPEKKHGRNRYRYDFTRPFNLYMKDKGAPWVTPHIMRHTFASLLASTPPSLGGPSDFEIITWMGIDWRTYQKTYAKLRPRPGAIDRAFKIDKELFHS